MKGLIALLLLVSASAAWGDIYTWKDSRGTAHYTNSLEEIPARYRGKARILDVATGKKGGLVTAQPPSVPAPAPSPALATPAAPPPQMPSQQVAPVVTPAPQAPPAVVTAPQLQPREFRGERKSRRRERPRPEE